VSLTDSVTETLHATTQPDDAFSLMRYSQTKYTGFGNGFGSDFRNDLEGFSENNFANGFIGNLPLEDRAPVASPDFLTVQEDGSVSLNLLSNDQDPDGGAIQLTSINGNRTGTTTLQSGASLRQPPGRGHRHRYIYLSDNRFFRETKRIRRHCHHPWRK